MLIIAALLIGVLIGIGISGLVHYQWEDEK